MTTQAGSVALSVGKIEAGSSSDVIDPPAPLVAADVGVRWVPVPGRGDRRRGALVSAVQLSYRDIEELLVERGVEVGHFTVYRGRSGSPRCWPTRPDSPAIHRAIGGTTSSSTPTTRSKVITAD
jgi:hypothetical protein